MFGIANQMLAAIALCVVTTMIINSGRARYAWITLLPMAFVMTTTATAGYQLVFGKFRGDFLKGWHSGNFTDVINSGLNIFFTVFMLACLLIILANALGVWADALRRAPGRTAS